MTPKGLNTATSLQAAIEANAFLNKAREMKAMGDTTQVRFYVEAARAFWRFALRSRRVA